MNFACMNSEFLLKKGLVFPIFMFYNRKNKKTNRVDFFEIIYFCSVFFISDKIIFGKDQ